MDLRNVVEDAMGGFESMAKKIPGYSGYKEKEQRREADALLREHLARELETQWARSNDLRSQMLIGPAMSQLDDMGKASRRLQTLIDKIKAAAQGYAGFFDAVKVKEDQLDALYEFDNDMLLRVDDIADAIDAVQAALDSEENVAPSAAWERERERRQ
ncbi:MAG: hypothetical protein B6243_14115 [Anaerolineaceae bacterium 4572_5.2]|nr:MAG: hypothetical protein B6243_14115 [Anaerolineaceae bacterium 4572_5.2]